MPHLVVEYSGNLEEPDSMRDLFAELHDILVEVGGISRANCKSRSRRADCFYIADGDCAHGFVHLDIRFLEGRSTEVKRAVGKRSLAALRRWFERPHAGIQLQITAEVRDIKREFYCKYPDGTLTPM